MLSCKAKHFKTRQAISLEELVHYDFSLPEPIWRGQLRPLRDPFAEDLLP